MKKERVFQHRSKLRATEKIFLALAIIFAFTILSFSNFGTEDKEEESLLGRILEMFRLEISQTLAKGNLITGAATGTEVVEKETNLENSITGLVVLNKQALSDSMPEILMGITIVLIILVIIYTIYHLKTWSGLRKRREEIIQKMEREINKVSGKVIFKEKPEVVEELKIIEKPKIIPAPRSVVQEIKPVQEWAGKRNLRFSDELEQINQKLMNVESFGIKIKPEKVQIKETKEKFVFPIKKEEKLIILNKPIREQDPKLKEELKKIEEELGRLS